MRTNDIFTYSNIKYMKYLYTEKKYSLVLEKYLNFLRANLFEKDLNVKWR